MTATSPPTGAVPSATECAAARRCSAPRAAAAQMGAYGELAGRWLLVRDPMGEPRLAQATAVAADHVLVSLDAEAVADSQLDSPSLPVWPEDILAVLDSAEDAADALARVADQLDAGTSSGRYGAQPGAGVGEEPLSRRERACAGPAIGWPSRCSPSPLTSRTWSAGTMLPSWLSWRRRPVGRSEVAPEANQAALSALVAECLPAGWLVRKGPAIHRLEKRVAVTVAPDVRSGLEPVARHLDDAEDRYVEISGYKLEIEDEYPDVPQIPLAATVADEPLEINAAYAVIRQALAGSSLYRTSLKDGAIVLTFISPQEGLRHQAVMDDLEQQIGWPLRIHPHPNQSAILDAARGLLLRQGWIAAKGPSIYPERGEVAVTLANHAAGEKLAHVERVFAERTGYQLHVTTLEGEAPDAAQPEPAVPHAGGSAIEIPIDRVRVPAVQQGLALNPAKLNKALTRARRDGLINPPIVVRRLRNEYLLLDGLYRLRAAQTLGHTHIQAEIEG